ncbi:MAG: hypothetical protein LCH62_14175 [Proteobacteria bacterium]|nr:hypothetical protein [Pseudomonadota bacterium]
MNDKLKFGADVEAKKSPGNRPFPERIDSAAHQLVTEAEDHLYCSARINFAELLLAIPGDFKFERDRTPPRITKL